MGGCDLVLGLLEASTPRHDLESRYRDLSIAWSRYGYRDAIIEAGSVEAILGEAADRGHRYCLIVAPGILIRESWQGEGSEGQDVLSSLAGWIEKHDFFVVGRILAAEEGWFGLDERWLLVDLERYRSSGRPRFGEASAEPRELPVADPVRADGEIRSLSPSDRTAATRPALRGWGLVEATLRSGLPVLALERRLADQFLDVASASGFERYLGDDIARYPDERDRAPLDADQRQILDVVALHAKNARRGVFLWNIESYADVETPPAQFRGPVSRLYSVAAGFKPNRILETHGFDANTSVVFFDYSQMALDVRRFTLEAWDGLDHPRWVAGLFERFPYPETYYHLWRDLVPDQLSPADLDSVWSRELARWGGEDAFAAHWRRYRELQHEFVHCDLVGDPAPLLERVSSDPGGVIWWSNAFFTVHSNWHYPWSERRERYEAFVSRLASRNPALLFYGSDHNNTNVNWISAGDYWTRYRELPGDELVPRKLHHHEIRM
jgi:hypothetical protein